MSLLLHVRMIVLHTRVSFARISRLVLTTRDPKSIAAQQTVSMPNDISGERYARTGPLINSFSCRDGLVHKFLGDYYLLKTRNLYTVIRTFGVFFVNRTRLLHFLYFGKTTSLLFQNQGPWAKSVGQMFRALLLEIRKRSKIHIYSE